MRRVKVKTLGGGTAEVLEPETAAERRELEQRTDLAVGGIDERDDDEAFPDDFVGAEPE